MVRIWDLMNRGLLKTIPTKNDILEYDPPLFNILGNFFKKYNLGYLDLRKILNYPSIIRRPANFYARPENFYVDLWSVIDKNKTFPSQSDLSKLGMVNLQIPIQAHGGYPAVAKSLGLEPLDMSAMGEYSQYKGDMAEAYLAPLIRQAALDNDYIVYPALQAPLPIKINGKIKDRELEVAFWERGWRPYDNVKYQHGVDITATDSLDYIMKEKLGEEDGYYKGLGDFGVPIVSEKLKGEKVYGADVPENTELIPYKDILNNTAPYFGRLFKKSPLQIPEKTKEILEVIAGSRSGDGKEGLEKKIEEVEEELKQKKVDEYLG